MKRVTMAARNIFRYKRRSLITASAIAFGVLFSIFMDGFIEGSKVDTIRNLRDYETGEGKIYPAGYFAERDLVPFSYFIEKADRQAIEKAAGRTETAPRVVASSELYFNEDFFAVPGSIRTTLFCVDPVRDARIFRTSRMVSDGRWLMSGDTGIVIGSWLAEDIGAKPGYVVTLECRGRGGFYQTFDAEILGIVKTDDPLVNRNAVFIDLAAADSLLALDGAVTEYTIRSNRTDAKLEAEGAAIAADTAGRAEFHPWRKVGESTLKLLRGQTGESVVFLFFIFVIAAVGIMNTMLMAVMERKNEIGMLRALGFGKAAIRDLFLLEGFGIGLIGTAAGLIAGCIANFFMVRYGMDFSFMLRDLDVGYRLTGVIRATWNFPGIARTVIGALAISTIVAWFPSGRILKREVAELLRK